MQSPISSVSWTGRDEAQPPYLLTEPPPHLLRLEPEPGDVEPLPDLFGQRAAIDTLNDICIAALRPDSATRRTQSASITIALCGRFGQGKTTVLSRLLAAFNSDPFEVRPINVEAFDIAANKPDMIHYEFDRLVANWTLGGRFFMLTVMAGCLFILYGAAVAAGLPANLKTFAVVVAGLSLPSILGTLRGLASGLILGAPLFREIGTAANFGDHRRIGQSLYAFARGRPDILIVDNLDRAIVEQQRAFLRSLRRHRRYLPPVVIVAFDETPLSLADPDPEAPQELMAKIFTTVVRLYPMTEADVLSILIHIYDILRKQTTDSSTAPWRFLRYPAVAGDVARILLAHRRHSVRFCYQFLNITTTASVTLGIVHPADFSALLRLQGLFEFLPWIRHDPHALADILTDNDADALLDYAARLLGRDRVSGEIEAGVRRYLDLTNHMQPYFADWHSFTGRFAGGLDDPENRHSRPTVGEDDSEEVFWFGRPKIDDRTFVLLWVAIDLKLAAETDPVRRRDFHEMILADPRHWILNIARDIIPASLAAAIAAEDYSRPELILLLTFLLQRLLLADTAVASRLANNRQDAGPELLILPTEAHSSSIRPKIIQSALTDPRIRNAFLQITRSAPTSTIPFFHAVVAASSFGSGELIRPSDGERRRLQLLEKTGAHRTPGQLPQLYGAPLDPTLRALHIVGLLQDFDVIDVPSSTPWDRIEGRCDLLGRLERANCGGLLEGVRSFVERAARASKEEPEFLAGLLKVAAAALPGFDAKEDGVWRSRSLDPFEAVFAALLDPARKPTSLAQLKDVSRSTIVPQILLGLLRFQKLGEGTEDPDFDYLDSLLNDWQPAFPWPESYLSCIHEILALPSGSLTGSPEVGALRHPRFKEILEAASRNPGFPAIILDLPG